MTAQASFALRERNLDMLWGKQFRCCAKMVRFLLVGRKTGNRSTKSF